MPHDSALLDAWRRQSVGKVVHGSVGSSVGANVGKGVGGADGARVGKGVGNGVGSTVGGVEGGAVDASALLLVVLLFGFGICCWLLLLTCYPKPKGRARPSLVFGFGPKMENW